MDELDEPNELVIIGLGIRIRQGFAGGGITDRI